MSSPTLLVVDDEPSVQKMVQKRGEKDGFRVLSALTLRDGFCLAVEERPDVVLLDMGLPDGLGSQLLKRLKADPRTRRIPIVVWTGRQNPDIKGQVLQAGAAAYVAKSDLATLMVTLRAIARISEASGVLKVSPVSDSDSGTIAPPRSSTRM
jgi:DNA-binding response OmpR family regulator